MCVPDAVLRAFENARLGIFEVTPAWMRAHLKGSQGGGGEGRRRQAAGDRECLLKLLQYCLSDMVLGAPPGDGMVVCVGCRMRHVQCAIARDLSVTCVLVVHGCRRGQAWFRALRHDKLARNNVPDSDGGMAYGDLCGLSIMPSAANGSLTIGQPTGIIKQSVLVATAQEAGLLAALQADIVDPALPSTVLDHLRSEAMTTYTNVKVLTAEVVAACLERVLPDGWKGIDEVQWRAGKDGQPDGKWMREFWEYASEERLPAFRDWPLLPTCEGTLCALGECESKVVDGASALSVGVKSVLSRLGVRMLDSEYINRRERLASRVHRPNLRGVLRALGVANLGSFESVCQRLEALPAADKRELRAFLLQRKWMTRDECSDEAAGMLLSLPLHEVCASCCDGDGEGTFCVVDVHKLPPPGAVPSLLTDTYLKATEEETEAYRFLGVGTGRLSGFYSEAVFPRLPQLDTDVCEEAMLGMLAALPQLCREDARFWDRLASLAFVKTGACVRACVCMCALCVPVCACVCVCASVCARASGCLALVKCACNLVASLETGAGKLARPWELYDPSVLELQVGSRLKLTMKSRENAY